VEETNAQTHSISKQHLFLLRATTPPDSSSHPAGIKLCTLLDAESQELRPFFRIVTRWNSLHLLTREKMGKFVFSIKSTAFFE
jgi:hypothetical protein